MDEPWRQLAQRQSGIVARRQLTALGVDWDYVQHRVDSERWQRVSSTVLATSTGSLTWEQRLWAAVLHCGGDAVIGGLTALGRHGLTGWDRDEVCMLVDDELKFDPLPGVLIVRTRRPLRSMRDPRHDLPICRLEPAALLWAGYEPVTRSAYGLLTACVQQGLTTSERLREWTLWMRPLRRSKPFQRLFVEIEGGIRSLAERDVTRMCRRFGLAEPDRQVRRRGSDGRLRYTDAEWHLPDGRVVVLEVDGAFHMEVEHWEDDIARERSLVGPHRVVIRASAREVRDDAHRVARDLKRLGVPGRGSQAYL